MFLTKLTVALAAFALVLFGMRKRRFRFEAERWQHLRLTRSLHSHARPVYCPVFRRPDAARSRAAFVSVQRD